MLLCLIMYTFVARSFTRLQDLLNDDIKLKFVYRSKSFMNMFSNTEYFYTLGIMINMQHAISCCISKDNHDVLCHNEDKIL